MKNPAPQRGWTLVELLVVLALSAALMAPLASMFRNAADSGATARAGLDMNSDARFAVDRIAQRVAALAPAAVDVAMSDANALLAPLSYTLSGADLVETDSSVSPARASVIATNVTAYRLSAPATGDGRPVVKIELALAAGGSTVSAVRTVRVGSPL
jgi:prepilin-type N-terminal cleavage/methylation domain-containing protein